jgi:hypothetical protein
VSPSRNRAASPVAWIAWTGVIPAIRNVSFTRAHRRVRPGRRDAGGGSGLAPPEGPPATARPRVRGGGPDRLFGGFRLSEGLAAERVETEP